MIIILIATVSTALAQPLLAVSCPETVYQHELFSCTVLMYNDSASDVNITYYAHFNKGLARLQSNGHGKLAIDSFTELNEEFNAWAVDRGTDIFLFEYGQKGVDSIAGKRVEIVQSPLVLDLRKFKVSAGQKAVVRARVVGKGELASVQIVLPPGVYGSKRVDLGDVDGKADFNISITTDPYYMGPVTIPFYLRFYDDSGEHVERYDVIMDVSPSLQVLAMGAAFLLLIVGAIYLGIRRIRGGAPRSEED